MGIVLWVMGHKFRSPGERMAYVVPEGSVKVGEDSRDSEAYDKDSQKGEC